ncbi:MAG: flavodoxin-dependent (E)-4-hydroxy-3-methylbut-2-enyl-diphosphate synthase [Alphaproteobacteria bacterium]
MSETKNFNYLPQRRKTRKVFVGKVAVGGDAPISVQSMTNTLTTDVKATVAQIARMTEAGADIARVSCPDEDSTKALAAIVKQSEIPVVADIHFHHKRAVEAAIAGAACLRINPGNIGSIDKVKEVIKAARDYGVSIRIGVNGGSLEKELLKKYGEPCSDAMVESALNQAKILEDNDFFEFKISVKSSNTLMTIDAYRKLSQKCDYPLHLGVTEAGGMRSGVVRSALGIGSLLMEGIGDTLRVSLSADVRDEVLTGHEILKTLGLRRHGVSIISCPTCARKGLDVEKTVAVLENSLANIKKPLTVAVMGCVVNGPGEAKGADIAVVGGGNGNVLVYLKGEQFEKISEENVSDYLIALINKNSDI